MCDLCSTLGIQGLPSWTVVLQGGCCSDKKGKGKWPTEELQHGEFRELQSDYPHWELPGEGDESTDQGKPQGSSDLRDLFWTMTLQGISLFNTDVRKLWKCFTWAMADLLRLFAELWQVFGQRENLQLLCITSFCGEALKSLCNVVQMWQQLLCCWDVMGDVMYLGHTSAK